MKVNMILYQFKILIANVNISGNSFEILGNSNDRFGDSKVTFMEEKIKESKDGMKEARLTNSFPAGESEKEFLKTRLSSLFTMYYQQLSV